MVNGYSLIGEPLNLCIGGQAWFRHVLEEQYFDHDCVGLVLGATSWLSVLLSKSVRRVVVVDNSAQMILMSRSTAAIAECSSRIDFVQADWLSLPAFSEPLGLAVGDNSFHFMTYPTNWGNLCDQLADNMRPRGLLITRIPSIPASHSRSSPTEIVNRFFLKESINFTELRATLLFSHCDPNSFAIDTEAVLKTFESTRHIFTPLLERFPQPNNDLLTIFKYKNAGIVYYAPTLDRVIDILQRRFDILAIHFGPTELRYYYPLIVAVRK